MTMMKVVLLLHSCWLLLYVFSFLFLCAVFQLCPSWASDTRLACRIGLTLQCPNTFWQGTIRVHPTRSKLNEPMLLHHVARIAGHAVARRSQADYRLLCLLNILLQNSRTPQWFGEGICLAFDGLPSVWRQTTVTAVLVSVWARLQKGGMQRCFEIRRSAMNLWLITPLRNANSRSWGRSWWWDTTLSCIS